MSGRIQPGRRGTMIVFLFVLAWMAPDRLHARDEAESGVAPISSDLRLRVAKGREISLEIRVAEGQGYAAIARRVGRGAGDAAAIAAWNDNRPLEADEWIGVSLSLLSPNYRRLVLQSLFPDDRRDGDDWIHVARSGVLPTFDEGLWQVAEWFTGRGADFEKLIEVNRLSSPELRPGQRVHIPADLLLPVFHSGLRSDDGALEFAADADGPYAGYRIRAGEALYSAVVVRFTGRTGGDDVRALADQIRARSGIPDLRDIPVGYLVKIPLDLLEPEFLPADHPKRREAEVEQRELAQALKQQPVGGTRGGLEGVLVIIDPGHGGRDLGTMNNGIWEHDYVYDVACRLKQSLEQHTAARVVMTLEDRETGCRPSKTDKLKANRRGTVLTHPPFLAKEEGEARIGVNLRWYLANSIYRKAKREGTADDRVVFMSLHADSRHPSLRGLMVYLPGAGYRTGLYGSKAKLYQRYAEVREKPQIRFSKSERVRSEAVSGKFAESVVQAFRETKLAIQPYQPVRNRIIRGKGRWVPAVLRGNAIPTKVLVEMVNLSNKEDAAVLASASRREDLADALFRSLFLHFGESPPPP